MDQMTMKPTRTDRIVDAVREELEDQRKALDANTPLTGVTVFVRLHPDGNVRSVKYRADCERDVPGRRVMLGERAGER